MMDVDWRKPTGVYPMRQQDIVDSLPDHLKPFVACQDYRRYTPRDQAVWRFLLHQLRDHLKHSAHPVYLEGLARTGISLEHIPSMEEMNASLQELGWRAVVVDGFIPPAIFMEFQAHRVLVIAVDMRTVEHMLYTPAPDIVHESAGHAPFIVDIDYAEFLQRFGELGMRAVSNRKDFAVYEAVRELSIVKEDPAATAEQIAAAEKILEKAVKANHQPSEAALLARLHWWTVEYGLVGDLHNYQLFGAGLLSSLGESTHCLDDEKVKKRLLTVDAIATPYDITTEQPQLFVTGNCRHLSQILEEFGRRMCVNRGGLSSLQQAIEAETVNTAVTNAGIEISGQFTELIADAAGNIIYIKTTGPSQLAYQGKELKGHGTAHHAEGFGCPIGFLQNMERCLSTYTIDELKQHHIVSGERVSLQFLSGIYVVGILKNISRRDQKNLVFTLDQCTVSTQDDDILFHPTWGTYDMAVGKAVVSVYGGSADPVAFPLYQPSPTTNRSGVSADAATQKLFAHYQQLRELRQSGDLKPGAIKQLESMAALPEVRNEWLLLFEVLELLLTSQQPQSICSPLVDQLKALAAGSDSETIYLIDCALQRLGLSSDIPSN